METDDKLIEIDIVSLCDGESDTSADGGKLEQAADELQNRVVKTPVTEDCWSSIELFLKKSKQRNETVENILDEVDHLLHDEKNLKATPDTENHDLPPTDTDFQGFATDNFVHHPDSKTYEEIEEANSIALENLNKLLLSEEADQVIRLQKEKQNESAALLQWEAKEQAVQKNLELMISKEREWERMYSEIAAQELASRENLLQEEFLQEQNRIFAMQDSETKILQEMLENKEKLQQDKHRHAATQIQKIFRGFSIRKKHGNEMREKLNAAKERRRLQRISVLEEKKLEEKRKMVETMEGNQEDSNIMIRPADSEPQIAGSSENEHPACEECPPSLTFVKEFDAKWETSEYTQDHDNTVVNPVDLSENLNQVTNEVPMLSYGSESESAEKSNACGDTVDGKDYLVDCADFETQISGSNESILEEVRYGKNDEEIDTSEEIPSTKKPAKDYATPFLQISDLTENAVHAVHVQTPVTESVKEVDMGKKVTDDEVIKVQLLSCAQPMPPEVDPPSYETLTRPQTLLSNPEDGLVKENDDATIIDNTAVTEDRSSCNPVTTKNTVTDVESESTYAELDSFKPEEVCNATADATAEDDKTVGLKVENLITGDQEYHNDETVEFHQGNAGRHGLQSECLGKTVIEEKAEIESSGCEAKEEIQNTEEKTTCSSSRDDDDNNILDVNMRKEQVDLNADSGGVTSPENETVIEDLETGYHQFLISLSVVNSALSHAKKQNFDSDFTHLLEEEEILDGSYDPDGVKSQDAESVQQVRGFLLCDTAGFSDLNKLAKCVHLTHLTVENCGLVSLGDLRSCINLQYINASRNLITAVSCDSMKNLRSFVLSRNRFTSIRSLRGCEALIYLDLSFNEISRISGTTNLPNVLHLSVSNNQLNSISGIKNFRNLLYLDLSENHLAMLDGVEGCGVLCFLNAAGNNLHGLSQEFLSNAVVLSKIDVSRNSIQALDFNPETQLPILTELNARMNRIDGRDTPLDFSVATPCLHYLDLSKNVIMDSTNLYNALAKCSALQLVDLSDNPFTASCERDSGAVQLLGEVILRGSSNKEGHHKTNIDKSFEFLCPLYKLAKKYGKLDRNPLVDANAAGNHSSVLSEEIDRHLNDLKHVTIEFYKEHHDKQNRSDQVVGRCLSKLISAHTCHLENLLSIAKHCRSIYKGDSKHCELPKEAAVDITSVTERPAPEHNTPSNTMHITPNAGDQQAGAVSPARSCGDQKRGLSEKVAIIPHSVENCCEADFLPSYRGEHHESGAMEIYSAVKIQSFWRGYSVRKTHAQIERSRTASAIKIQSVWRGYHCRSKIRRAMTMLQDNKHDADMPGELEDVNLNSYNFDETSFDDDWALGVTSGKASSANIEGKSLHGRLPHQNYSVNSFAQPESNPMWRTRQQSQPLQSYHDGSSILPIPRPPQQAWEEKIYSKPPLPNLFSRKDVDSESRSTFSESRSIVDSVASSEMTKRSMKQKILTDQWGIKSDGTAELMMRRARRMRGGRKKELTADAKYHRFQEKMTTHNAPPSSTDKHRNNAFQNMDCVKAREMGIPLDARVAVDDEAQKQQYTYEWLHNQVKLAYQPHKPIQRNDIPKSSFLPPLPRSPSLVGVQDLEIASVGSSSHMSQSKDRLKAIVKRHNPQY